MSTASSYLHGARRFRVTAVLTIVKVDGHLRRFNRDQILPPTVGQGLIDHLLAHGQIIEVETPGEGTK